METICVENEIKEQTKQTQKNAAPTSVSAQRLQHKDEKLCDKLLFKLKE